MNNAQGVKGHKLWERAETWEEEAFLPQDVFPHKTVREAQSQQHRGRASIRGRVMIWCIAVGGARTWHQGWWYRSNGSDCSAAQRLMQFVGGARSFRWWGREPRGHQSAGGKLTLAAQEIKMSACWVFMILMGYRLSHATPSQSACEGKLYTLLQHIDSSF